MKPGNPLQTNTGELRWWDRQRKVPTWADFRKSGLWWPEFGCVWQRRKLWYCNRRRRTI